MTNFTPGRGDESEQRSGMSREEAGRLGGLAVSEDRKHMQEIGRIGGKKVSENLEHMRAIGRKGGQKSGGREQS